MNTHKLVAKLELTIPVIAKVPPIKIMLYVDVIDY
jgi:hypothetical protein